MTYQRSVLERTPVLKYSYMLMTQKYIKLFVIRVNAETADNTEYDKTRSSAIAEGPRDASCQLKSCQLPRNSAETTYMTSPDQIDGMKLEI